MVEVTRMRDALPAPAEGSQGEELGTLWTLQREESTARCALLVFAEGCELHVFVDGEPLLSQRCEVQHEVFELAERWRARMAERGWKKADVSVRLRPDRRDSPR
jgi:hypothetical protein